MYLHTQNLSESLSNKFHVNNFTIKDQAALIYLFKLSQTITLLRLFSWFV